MVDAKDPVSPDGGGVGAGLLVLAAGPVTVRFDPRSGFLRHLEWGGVEVLRGIYGAVRDRNWDTVEPVVDGVEVSRGEDSFEIQFRATCREARSGVDYVWRGTVCGNASGEISYRFAGVAGGKFFKNRIGLCVLHPAPGCPGVRCQVEHGDGTVTDGVFPEAVSPHQPFFDIAALTHEVGPGRKVEVRFDGEGFEMEDQRNWTDASFKTYSTPLADPFPVEVAPGDEVVHTVTVTPSGHGAGTRASPSPRAKTIEVDWDRPVERPPVGVQAGADPADPEALANLLEHVRPAHLRVDLEPSAPGWRERLASAVEQAAGCGATLHLALHLDPADAGREFAAVDDALGDHRVAVSLVLVFAAGEATTPPGLVEAAARHFPGAAIAGGTDAYFAELNRCRPAPGTAAIPCFSINPQVHAFDDLSLVESLAAQPATVASTLGFSPGPVAVSPVTLLPRFNPNATAPGGGEAPAADPRQSMPFTAAWALGSFSQLLPCPGVHSLTYFESHGPRGLGDGFGRTYPAAGVFAALHGYPLAFPTVVSHPFEFAALALGAPDGARRLLVASFLTDTQTIAACGRVTEVPPRAITEIDP